MTPQEPTKEAVEKVAREWITLYSDHQKFCRINNIDTPQCEEFCARLHLLAMSEKDKEIEQALANLAEAARAFLSGAW